MDIIIPMSKFRNGKSIMASIQSYILKYWNRRLNLFGDDCGKCLI